MTENLFDQYADNYEGYRKDLIPGYEEFYGVLLERIETTDINTPDVLDLGAGTGLSTEHVLHRFPSASVTLVDESTEMLDQARERFDDKDLKYRDMDLRNLEIEEGEYDAVISALVLHYVSNSEKRSLIEKVYKWLKPGGVFSFGMVVEAPNEDVRQEYENKWTDYARSNNVPESIIEDAQERLDQQYRSSPNEVIEWLRKSNFGFVDCWYKNYSLAVFSGTKPHT